jgi:hypothetical protein
MPGPKNRFNITDQTNKKNSNLKMNVIGWLMTASILFGMISWAVYSVIDAAFIKRVSLRTLITPSINWGPLLVKNKRLATHLENLEAYHESKMRNRIHKEVSIRFYLFLYR